jgi:hypothetical protein
MICGFDRISLFYGRGDHHPVHGYFHRIDTCGVKDRATPRDDAGDSCICKRRNIRIDLSPPSIPGVSNHVSLSGATPHDCTDCLVDPETVTPSSEYADDLYHARLP